MNKVHRLSSIHLLGKLLAQDIDAGLDYGLEPPDRCFGEEIAEGAPSSTMEGMAHSTKGHISAAEHACRP